MWFPEREKERDIGKVLLSNYDSLARESCRIWLRRNVWYEDTGELKTLAILSLLMLFYHTQSKQSWWPDWTGQQKQGMEEIKKVVLET